MGNSCSRSQRPREEKDPALTPRERGQNLEKVADAYMESKYDLSSGTASGLDDDPPPYTSAMIEFDDGYYTMEEKMKYERPIREDRAERPEIRWQKGNILGAGAFGKVYLGLNLTSGELLAIKQVSLAGDLTDTSQIEALEWEIDVLRHLEHDNIVAYLGTSRDDENLNIFLEYVLGGSLSSLLKKFGNFNEPVIRVYTQQILRGLHYLHAHRIIHRDIKGANLLVDHAGTIKLADFGASTRLQGIHSMTGGKASVHGTPYWMAPEVIKQTGTGRQADIWSVGCTVLEMATGKPPWSDTSDSVAAMFRIAQSTAPPPIPAHLSPEAKDFLMLCFRRDPQTRPNAATLLEHPFVNIQNHSHTPTTTTPTSQQFLSPSSPKVSRTATTPEPDMVFRMGSRQQSTRTLRSVSNNNGRGSPTSPSSATTPTVPELDRRATTSSSGSTRTMSANGAVGAVAAAAASGASSGTNTSAAGATLTDAAEAAARTRNAISPGGAAPGTPTFRNSTPVKGSPRPTAAGPEFPPKYAALTIEVASEVSAWEHANPAYHGDEPPPTKKGREPSPHRRTESVGSVSRMEPTSPTNPSTELRSGRSPREGSPVPNMVPDIELPGNIPRYVSSKETSPIFALPPMTQPGPAQPPALSVIPAPDLGNVRSFSHKRHPSIGDPTRVQQTESVSPTTDLSMFASQTFTDADLESFEHDEGEGDVMFGEIQQMANVVGNEHIHTEVLID